MLTLIRSRGRHATTLITKIQFLGVTGYDERVTPRATLPVRLASLGAAGKHWVRAARLGRA